MSVQSRVTLAAVARQARVSLATASKVLNGRDGVGTDTRHRVEAILADVGYIAQGAPRSTGDVPLTGASLMILVQSVIDPYTSAVIAGVLNEADVLGTNVVIRQLHQVGRQHPTGWAHLGMAVATAAIGLTVAVWQVAPVLLLAFGTVRDRDRDRLRRDRGILGDREGPAEPVAQ